MTSLFKRINRTLSLLVTVAKTIWRGEGLARLKAVNSLFDEEKIVHNFSNMNAAFLNVDLDHGGAPISPLPTGPEM